MYELAEIERLSEGRWDDLLLSLCGVDPRALNGRHGPCPACGGEDRFRYDDKSHSGTWYCSQCGGKERNGGAGNGIDLLMRITGLQFPAALQAVGDYLRAPDSATGLPRLSTPPKPKPPAPDSLWSWAGPLSQGDIEAIEALDFVAWNPKKEVDAGYSGSRLRPVLASIYRDQYGVPIGAVVRIEINGKKITPQIIRAKDSRNGEERLIFGSMPSPRPLLGGHLVSGEKPVFVVEGEKTHAAASGVLTDCEVVTWCGGAKVVKLADWELLQGLTVYIWPDADDDGAKAAAHIDELLRGHGCSVFIVRPPVGVEKGWDLADAVAEGWDKQRILDYIEACTRPIVSAQEMTPAIAHYSECPRLSERDWHQITTKGKPFGTLDNFRAMLTANGIKPRYNMISKAIEAPIPGVVATLDNAENVILTHIISIAQKNEYPTANLSDYLCAFADENAYNPVANWIASREWDGVDRLPQFFATIPSDNVALRDMILTKWLIGSVALQFCEQPTELHGVVILKGKQGTGKTKWCRSLMPPELSDRYIMTGATLDPTSKDSVTACISRWIVELGEFGATVRKADQDRLKSFLTNGQDTVRRPYDRRNSNYQRRTAFLASVNDDRFLKDETGTRRYWVINQTGNIDYNHGIDTQQVFAQALSMYRAGVPHWMDAAEREMLELANSEYMELCPVTERIDSALDWDAPTLLWRAITATDLLLELGFANPSPHQANRASAHLGRLGCDTRRTATARFRVVPPKKGGEYV